MGLFITFEGIEGCGKTTQVGLAAEFLDSEGISHLVTEEPGATPLGAHIRKLLLNRNSFSLNPEAELFLFLADRAQHVRDVVLPALAEGKTVLCDRFSDASIAYQGFGRGLEVDTVRMLDRVAAGTLRPDRTFLFDLPVETSIGRAMRRIGSGQSVSPEDRFEREEIAFHRRVRKGYLDLARKEPDRFVIVDGTGEIAAVQGRVRTELIGLLRKNRK
ncbi:MAG: dTMP kinase [Syntrophales bacterium]|nr:dTMP kinase [Syntrophales bacterium]